MLIWINGAFGSGKTQTAHELLRRTSETRVAVGIRHIRT